MQECRVRTIRRHQRVSWTSSLPGKLALPDYNERAYLNRKDMLNSNNCLLSPYCVPDTEPAS